MFNLHHRRAAGDSGQIALPRPATSRAVRSARIARAGMARTFQHVKLRPHMSLLDNVRSAPMRARSAGFFAGALRLDRAEEARARPRRMRQLERVGLGDTPHELAGNLPLGNQRILEIARALAADPVLLVLDEPAAGLRRQEKRRSRELLRSAARRGRDHPDRRARHGLRDGAGRPLVVMDFGCQAVEGRRPRCAPTRGCRKPISGASRDARDARRSTTCTSPTARSRRCAACRWRSSRARSSR